MTRSRGIVTVVLPLFFAALMSLDAHAQQQPDSNTKATARKLANEGIKLFDQGRYAEALEKFSVADSLVPAPTLGLRAARCLVKLGRYVEASERYVEVTRMQLDRGANPALRKAQADALVERDQLLSRIPTLEVVLEGPVGDGVAITVDDHPMAGGLVGQKQPIDPGTHKIAAKRGETVVTTEVTLAEGSSQQAVLKLPPLPPKPLPPPPADPGKTQRFVGWTVVGVGAAGVVIGALNGVLALSTQSSLLQKCPDRKCPPSAYGQESLYDAMRAISSVGFIVGALGLASGIPLVITAKRPDAEPPKASLTAIIFAGGAGVRGEF